jgi:phosphomannomutase/phosphoglucomutase
VINAHVFREYDIRGVVDTDFGGDFVERLGRAVGETLTERAGAPHPRVVVGRDCRLSSPALRDRLVAGLTASGAHVVDIGMVPTPAVYYAVHEGVPRADGGVQVTGSHNPPHHNGFKVLRGTTSLYGDAIRALHARMSRGGFVDRPGSVTAQDVAPAWREAMLSRIRAPGRRLRVVVDAGNGMAGPDVVPLVEALGHEVTALYCAPDGRFPNHHPDPTEAHTLRDLIARVRAEGADVGLAFDGDADRVGVVDERGAILWGDRLLALLAPAVLAAHPGAVIIGEVKCSRTVFDEIARLGGQPMMWKAGHSLIKARMLETRAVLAGEMSGHLFFADRYFGYDDALYAALRILEVVASQERPLSSLLGHLPSTFTTPETRVDCPDEIKFAVVAMARERFARSGRIIDVDGVRVEFADGWGLVRASNTQPALVLRCEAETEARLLAIREMVEGGVRDLMATARPS